MSIIPLATLESLEVLEGISEKAPAAITAQDWDEVVKHGKGVADGLRTELLRTELGKSGLVASCATLLPRALEAASPAAITEILRVLGNLCFDHDPNRQLCHDAGVAPVVLDVLSAWLGLGKLESASPKSAGREFSLDDLKLIRAAVGALMNMSLKFDPIREELHNPAALSILLALLDTREQSRSATGPIYVLNSWAGIPVGDIPVWKARVQVSSMIAGWAMNVLEDLLSDDKVGFPPAGIVSLSSVILSSQIPTPPQPTSTWSAEEASDLLDTDLELLTLAASLLEGLSIDLELAKQEIAFARYDVLPASSSPHSATLLSHLFTFIASASPPSNWTSSEDPAYGLKAFSTVKSAVVRAVVEAPNSDAVMEKLFAAGQGKNWVLEQLVEWVGETQEGREDLLICSAHMLAALGRKDDHCVALVQEYGLAEPLAQLVVEKVRQQLSKTTVRPGEVTQILFGVVSLLRHLSIPVANKAVLGATGVIETVSLLLRPELDMVTPLQNAVVGLLKHLTASNVPNSLHFIGASETPSDVTTLVTSSASASPTYPSTAMDAVIALIPRTDDVRLRSEASRTLVNVVRSFFSTKPVSGTDLAASSPISPSTHGPSSTVLDEAETLKRRGRPRIVRPEVVSALSEMVRLSERYPMLINEAVVGLTLLAGSGAVGALLVLDALVLRHAPTPPEPTSEDGSTSSSLPSSAPTRTTSLAISPAGDPATSLDMLVTWLGYAAAGRLASSSSDPTSTATAAATGVRPEMVTNVCALLITVMRGAEVAKADKETIDGLRVQVLGPLHGVAETSEGTLKKVAGRALEVVEGK